ncbi:hypothetical protein Hypma_009158 [Hypsizygus marmoreus]|uniref:Uncharacterized protein n=1 Tax=Hypsizygus marmoreus TaxID=39966 RepID=A0A369JVJ9_HYPMA|nr:hypothetical protein Hypma_009158 [Hypsizygus marmoreus]
MPLSTRRLSARRGSVTAPDPFNIHPHPVQSSSTLTIVRVTSPPPHPEQVPAPSSSPRRIHRRLPSQPQSAASPESPRLSFAFSSFAGPGQAHGGPATIPSPSSSPRLRPSSPHRPASPHRLSALPSVPRLSPDQLLDLARSSTHPHYTPQPHDLSPSHSPQLRPHSPITAPATFTPLPDHIHLPFIDRPSEVAALISSAPSAKLFSLLAQTFHPVPASDQIQDPTATPDPTKWTYAQLYNHLTHSTRHQTSDVLWVLQARKCILFHSELIWERIKGALGVPPDLDVDYDPSQPLLLGAPDFSSSRSNTSVDTDEISDDHGRAARGHWEDWDAVMDSPVYNPRHPSGPGSPVIPLSLSSSKFIAQISDRLHHTPNVDAREFSEDITSSTLVTSIGTPSPPHSGTVTPSSFLSIEPLLAPSASSPSHLPSISPPSALATSEIIGLTLDDIEEGAEDEEEASTPGGEEPQQEEGDHDTHLVVPSQIQGLRISTAPAPAPLPVSVPTPDLPPPQTHTSLSAAGSPLHLLTSTSASSTSSSSYIAPPPVSPLPPYPYPVPRSRPVSGSFVRPASGSYGFPSVFRRSGSFGSSVGSVSAMGSVRGAGGEGVEEEEEEEEEEGEERGHVPLFPSNFAKLSAEPTLGVGHGQGHGEHLAAPGPGYGGAPKTRTFSMGSAGGSVAGYKRMSWGATAGAAAV